MQGKRERERPDRASDLDHFRGGPRRNNLLIFGHDKAEKRALPFWKYVFVARELSKILLFRVLDWSFGFFVSGFVALLLRLFRTS